MSRIAAGPRVLLVLVLLVALPWAAGCAKREDDSRSAEKSANEQAAASAEPPASLVGGTRYPSPSMMPSTGLGRV